MFGEHGVPGKDVCIAEKHVGKQSQKSRTVIPVTRRYSDESKHIQMYWIDVDG